MPNPRAQKNANLRSTATGIYDAVTQGLLPMLGNAARGSVAATLGAPGDILGLLSDKQPLPTSQNILDYIPAAGSDKNVIGMGETMGGFVPTPGSSGLARVAKTAVTPSTYGKSFMQAQAPAVMSPITAWHGSPHKFNKFDNSKMGTGEGAQAYGAGAYLADNPAVADEYRRMLSTNFTAGDLYFNGKLNQTFGTTGNRELDDYLLSNLGDFSKTRKNILDDIKYVREGNRAGAKESQKTLADLRKIKDKISAGTEGYIYKADIPDEAVSNMLLWEKTLAEQPESVKNALLQIPQIKLSKETQPTSFDSLTGKRIYRLLANEPESMGLPEFEKTQQQASRYLNSLGIPGIRYFDGTSRKAGQGTMNTVVFDDSLIKILERNGEPMGLLSE